MPRLTRRRLLAAGGAAGAASVLAACGASEEEARSSENDTEIGSAAAAAELTLQSAYDNGALSALAPDHKVLYERQSQRVTRLGDLAGGLPSGAQTKPPANGSTSPEQGIELAGQALAAYRAAAAELSTEEQRAAAFESFASLAADLAVLRAAVGEEPSPFAFVTGGAEEPYEDTDFDPTADE
jgi:hypothetical protein